MSNQITTAFVQQYSNNVQMLSQQKGSLRGVVDVETVNGKHAYFEELVLFQLLRELADIRIHHRSIHHTQEEECQWLTMNGLT